jgi:hypothetical protein
MGVGVGAVQRRRRPLVGCLAAVRCSGVATAEPPRSETAGVLKCTVHSATISGDGKPALFRDGGRSHDPSQMSLRRAKTVGRRRRLSAAFVWTHPRGWSCCPVLTCASAPGVPSLATVDAPSAGAPSPTPCGCSPRAFGCSPRPLTPPPLVDPGALWAGSAGSLVTGMSLRVAHPFSLYTCCTRARGVYAGPGEYSRKCFSASR